MRILWLATALGLTACSGNGHESSVNGDATGAGAGSAGATSSSASSSVASSGSGGATTTATGTGGATVLPACTWPTSFDPVDAGGDGQCTAGRAFLSCAGPGGIHMLCLSDNATQCPKPTPDGYTCTDECHPDEFGAGCGHLRPGAQPPAPAGCRTLGPTPAGPVFYCCPCGS